MSYGAPRNRFLQWIRRMWARVYRVRTTATTRIATAGRALAGDVQPLDTRHTSPHRYQVVRELDGFRWHVYPTSGKQELGGSDEKAAQLAFRAVRVAKGKGTMWLIRNGEIVDIYRGD